MGLSLSNMYLHIQRARIILRLHALRDTGEEDVYYPSRH